MLKSAVRPMNSSKNKLNSEIIFIYNPNPNARYIYHTSSSSIGIYLKRIMIYLIWVLFVDSI